MKDNRRYTTRYIMDPKLDILGLTIAWGITGVIIAVALPTGIGLLIAAFVDEPYFKYGITGAAVCGGLVLGGIIAMVVEAILSQGISVREYY